MNSKRVMLAVGLAVGLVVGAKPAVPVAQAAETIVRFHEYPGSIAHLVNWAMVDKGFCKKEGIVCQPIYLANGPLAQQAAAAGSVDLIYSSVDLMMQAVAKGLKLQVVATQQPSNVYVLAVRSDIAQPHRAAGYPEDMTDLKGRIVGVSARGSATELYVDALLAGAGMAPESVTYVGVGAPNTAFAAIQAKQVDAVLSWDPLPARCDATRACDVLVDLRKGQGPADVRAMNGGFGAWQATREYVEKNGPAVDAFVRALSDATAWVKDPANFHEVMDLARKHFKLGDVPNRDKVLEQLVKEMIAQYGTHFDRASIKAFNDFLLKNKRISAPIDPESIVYSKTP